MAKDKQAGLLSTANPWNNDRECQRSVVAGSTAPGTIPPSFISRLRFPTRRRLLSSSFLALLFVSPALSSSVSFYAPSCPFLPRVRECASSVVRPSRAPSHVVRFLCLHRLLICPSSSSFASGRNAIYGQIYARELDVTCNTRPARRGPF